MFTECLQDITYCIHGRSCFDLGSCGGQLFALEAFLPWRLRDEGLPLEVLS